MDIQEMMKEISKSNYEGVAIFHDKNTAQIFIKGTTIDVLGYISYLANEISKRTGVSRYDLAKLITISLMKEDSKDKNLSNASIDDLLNGLK